MRKERRKRKVEAPICCPTRGRGATGRIELEKKRETGGPVIVYFHFHGKKRKGRGEGPLSSPLEKKRKGQPLLVHAKGKRKTQPLPETKERGEARPLFTALPTKKEGGQEVLTVCEPQKKKNWVFFFILMKSGRGRGQKRRAGSGGGGKVRRPTRKEKEKKKKKGEAAV